MIGRALSHRLFAPALLLAVLGVGALTVGFLLVGPGLGPWADTLLTSCFGWNADTRRYRLDSLILALLQPPLFAGVIVFFYADELRAFLRSLRGRLVTGLGAGVFLALAVSLLATSEISASGAPPQPAAVPAPIREGRDASGFSLIDHRERPVALADLLGRPVVMTFIYAGCHVSCPLLVERMRALERRHGGADTVFLAVTLDPEHDSPAALRDAAARWGLGDRWHLLTGRRPADVRGVAAAYGVHWAPLPDGEIAHDNVIFLIDRRGRLAFTYRGLGQPEERQAKDLARLISERS